MDTDMDIDVDFDLVNSPPGRMKSSGWWGFKEIQPARPHPFVSREMTKLIKQKEHLSQFGPLQVRPDT